MKSKRNRSSILDLKMPGSRPRKAEEYLCTSSPRLSSQTSYIVEYEPHAEASTAHHILLIGCKYLASRSRIWKCDGNVCDGEEHIIYAWAKNAKAIKMPKGVGFAVGRSTGINYIAMQVHYARALKGAERDYSGIKIHMTNERVKHRANIFMLGAGEAKIPPRSIGFHADVACRYERPYDLVPFAFRTHAHSTARVISGYRVRNGKWKLIGIGNPQLPQIFYPIPPEKRAIIHRGDILAGRCTYDTPHRNRWTHMGATSKDEMCNFYFMYYKIFKGKKGSDQRVRQWYASDCEDIEYGISKKELQFPADSDKLPASMKLNGTMQHHHNHHSMSGDDFDVDDDAGDSDADKENDGSVGGDDVNNDDGGDGGDDADSRSAKSRQIDKEDVFDGFDPDDRELNERLGLDEVPEENTDEAVTRGSDTVANEEENEKPKRHQKLSNDKESERKKAEAKLRHDSMESDLNNLVTPKEKTRADVDLREHTPKANGDWPYEREELRHIGQVTALGLSKKDLLIFHRGDRVWSDGTFDGHDRLNSEYRKQKISSPTIYHLDPETGAVKKKWGQNLFYLPHGLVVDKHGNIWVTDVGSHQVHKFSPNDLSTPALTLGVALRPGNDNRHFCKPTDVAVDSNGNFFVADGYCNGRIMKFSPKGSLIKQWGRKNRGRGRPGPGEFDVPHSLALDDEKNLLYIADRENGRIQCYNTDGKLQKIIHAEAFGGRLFAISFTPFNGGLLYAVSGPSLLPSGPRPSGFTIDPKSGKVLGKWSPFSKGFGRPHDVQVTKDNSAVFVCEIGPNRVWKFNLPEKETQKMIKDSEMSKEDRRSEKEDVLPAEPKTTFTQKGDVKDKQKNISLPPYKIRKPEDESNLIPAIVVVVVLATPIALICAAATIQHLRFKHQREKALRRRNEDALSSKPKHGCFSCCRTKKYYYDHKRGFDKLIGEDDSDESEDDYFVRKGAI
eukprot:gene6077-11458_t